MDKISAANVAAVVHQLENAYTQRHREQLNVKAAFSAAVGVSDPVELHSADVRPRLNSDRWPMPSKSPANTALYEGKHRRVRVHPSPKPKLSIHRHSG